MGSECRGVIEAISTLSSDNEEEICSTISAVEEYLNGLLYDKRHFKRAYVAICTKIFEVTCQFPYHRMYWLVHMGVASDVINTLCTCLATSSLQGSHLIQQLVKEYCTSRMKEMLWSEQLEEQTINNLINIPQLLGNQMQLNLEEYFIPKIFYTTLIAAVCDVLVKCHTAISTGSHDCSLGHLSSLVSKIITSGYHGAVDHVISYLETATSKDMIWQRISYTFINHLTPYAVDIFVERVLLTTKPSLMSSSGTCRILGNTLQTQGRLPHALCYKSLLVRHYPEPWLLYNIAGYLRSSLPGKQLMQKVTLVNLLSVWSNVSLIRHVDYPHLLHISRAIVLFTCCLGDDNFLSSEICSDLFHQLMQGMEHHMSNPMTDQRSVAMRLAECVSQKISKEGSPLKFDINESNETILLSKMSMPISEQEEQLHNDRDHVIQPLDNMASPADHVTQPKNVVKLQVIDDDDDDDDDLIPYVSVPYPHDVPHYLREAISVYPYRVLVGLAASFLGILEASPSDRLNLLKVLPNLIKSQPHDLDEVCDELCKILLHWGCFDEEGKQTTKEALVALLCNCPVQAATYLTEQFHCHGYSIEQRLFILDLLSLSSLQLSSSHDAKGANQFIPVAGHFFFPLMKYFEQKEKVELVIAHVIHTLAHVIHCAATATISDKMSEHLLELLLEYRSHPNAFIRQSTLCGITIILSTSSSINCPMLISEWLQGVINNDSDSHCRLLATEAVKLL